MVIISSSTNDYLVLLLVLLPRVSLHNPWLLLAAVLMIITYLWLLAVEVEAATPIIVTHLWLSVVELVAAILLLPRSEPQPPAAFLLLLILLTTKDTAEAEAEAASANRQ